MAAVETSPKEIHSPPSGPAAKRPRGILKNSFQRSPPTSPVKETRERKLSEKELTIHNTQANAGHRRSSSAASRPAGSRRQSSRTPSTSADASDLENQQRLKWDEANIYLTEQERTATMKITEPKTPYAKHYEPSEDEDDLDDEMLDSREDIPGLSLGEPEEEVPEGDITARKSSKVHVNDNDATPEHDAESEVGLSAEDKEKHRRFEEMRKKHYEMREVVGMLGHPEILEEELADEEDDDEDGTGKGKRGIPPVPKLPPGINGSSS